GILQGKTSRPDAAEKSFAAALAIQTRFLTDESPRPDDRKGLANMHISRGHLRLVSGKRTEAETDYLDAEKALAGLRPEECLEESARVQSSLATLWAGTQPGKAAKAVDRAVAGWKALCERSREPRFRHELAMAHLTRGVMADTGARQERAEAEYEQATAILTKLTSEYHDVIGYRETLGTLRHNHGQLLHDLGRDLEAEKVWRGALPGGAGAGGGRPGRPPLTEA